jgi:hypothetical protein
MTEADNGTVTRGLSWLDYRALLSAFLDRDYKFCSFADLNSRTGQIILRHDVDMSLSAALDIAKIEAEMGISAHYFVLLRTEFYNVMSPTDWKRLKAIQDLGHDIGLHFDASLYLQDNAVMDMVAGIECDILEQILQRRVTSISFHRPVKSLQGLDRPLAGRLHTYQPRFFSDISYASDSQGMFRFGHPLDSESFRSGLSIQLLTHPIWWAQENTIEKMSLIDKFLDARFDLLRSEAAANCIPYAKRMSEAPSAASIGES